MSLSNAAENAIAKLIFQAVAWANMADNAAAAPFTNLYLSLHTGDPGEAGDQSTSEISYTGYARVAVLRTAGGWTVTANVVTPVAAITFGQMTAGAGGTATFVGIGTAASGAGILLFSGALSPTLAVVNGFTPQIGATATITWD